MDKKHSERPLLLKYCCSATVSAHRLINVTPPRRENIFTYIRRRPSKQNPNIWLHGTILSSLPCTLILSVKSQTLSDTRCVFKILTCIYLHDTVSFRGCFTTDRAGNCRQRYTLFSPYGHDYLRSHLQSAYHSPPPPITPPHKTTTTQLQTHTQRVSFTNDEIRKQKRRNNFFNPLYSLDKSALRKRSRHSASNPTESR